MIAKLRTGWLLGSRLLRQLALAPFRPAGGPLLLRRFAPDGLVPLAEADLQRVQLLSLCDGCGLCDQVCMQQGALARAPEGMAPSELMLALSRSLPHLSRARLDLDAFGSCSVCQACQAACPRGIPVDEVASWCHALLLRLPGGLPPAGAVGRLPGRAAARPSQD